MSAAIDYGERCDESSKGISTYQSPIARSTLNTCSVGIACEFHLLCNALRAADMAARHHKGELHTWDSATGGAEVSTAHAGAMVGAQVVRFDVDDLQGVSRRRRYLHGSVSP